jgi:hypothetical protein
MLSLLRSRYVNSNYTKLQLLYNCSCSFVWARKVASDIKDIIYSEYVSEQDVTENVYTERA